MASETMPESYIIQHICINTTEQYVEQGLHVNQLLILAGSKLNYYGMSRIDISCMPTRI